MKKALIWVGAAVFSAAITHAQNTDSSKAVLLDEVTITANKTSQKQSQTGKVVTIINRKTIEQQPGKTLAQLVQEQAGITINGALNNAGTNQSVYTRGSSSGRTLILIDGVPAYDPSLIFSEFDMSLINLQQVERIEIARGAQSTLYGSDAVGGVINIITTLPEHQKGRADLVTSYGSFNTFRLNTNLAGSTNKWSYAVKYGMVSSKGFSSANDQNDAGNFDNDGFKSYNTRADLGYQLTPHLFSKVFLQYNKYDTDIDDGAFRDDRDFTSGNKNLMTGAQLRYKKKNISLTANYFYNDVDRNLLNDSGHVSGFASFTQNDFNGISQFAELFANINIGKGYSILAGGDYRYANMNSYLLSISSFGPFEDVQTKISARQYAGYASLLYNSNKFNVEAGFRYNKHSQFGNNTTFTFNPSFNISNHFRLFGSMASAFKVPSLYQLYSAFGNPDLQAEKSISYEAGIQQTHASISNRVVFFYRDIDNGIDYDYVNFTYFNFNNQKVSGIEWEIAWKPIENLSVTGNYTWLNPTETSQSRVTTKDTTYSYLLRRPTHQVNLAVQWQATKKFSMGIEGRYLSERYDVGGFQVPDVRLDSYFLLGANAAYTMLNNHLSFFAQAQNLLNKTFFDLNGFNSMPFNLQVGLRAKL